MTELEPTSFHKGYGAALGRVCKVGSKADFRSPPDFGSRGMLPR